MNIPYEQSGTMKKKHQPIRTCIGCGRRDDKRKLRRMIISHEGRIAWDDLQQRKGRGAYVCNTAKCMKSALNESRLSKAFRQNTKR